MPEILAFNRPKTAGLFLETGTANRILALLAYCHNERDMGIIVGAPGVGKTTAIDHYAAQNGNTVAVCTMNPTMKSMSAALNRIGCAMKVWGSARAPDMHERICDSLLHERNKIELLVIDEAQHLSDPVIDEIRCIHDETSLGAVLCGNAYMRTRFSNANSATFGQFTSRIGMRLDISEPSDRDLEDYCLHRGITGQKSLNLLRRYATSAGGLRVVEKIIIMAEKFPDSGNDVAYERIAKACKVLGLGA